MKKTVLISLVSKQTLPNVLFIKSFDECDEYVFITTPQMEKLSKSLHIKEATNKKGEVIEINDANDYENSLAIFKNRLPVEDSARYILNLTAGTKIMMLSIFDYLKQECKEGSMEAYYLPVYRNEIFRIYPTKVERALDVELNLHEYLRAYGYDLNNATRLSDVQSQIKRLTHYVFEQIVVGEQIKDVKKRIGDLLVRGGGVEGLEGLSRSLYRKIFNNNAWFEIFSADLIQRTLDLSDDQIALNVKLTGVQAKKDSGQSSQEYDVVFTKNNKLFIGECKTGKFSSKKIKKDWYKLAGAKEQLGLHVVPFFLAASEINSDARSNMNEEKKYMGIKGIADVREIADEEKFREFLKGLMEN